MLTFIIPKDTLAQREEMKIVIRCELQVARGNEIVISSAFDGVKDVGYELIFGVSGLKIISIAFVGFKAAHCVTVLKGG